MSSTFSVLGDMLAEAAALAGMNGQAYTIVGRYAPASHSTFELSIFPSHEASILHQSREGWRAVASVLPTGTIELYNVMLPTRITTHVR